MQEECAVKLFINNKYIKDISLYKLDDYISKYNKENNLKTLASEIGGDIGIEICSLKDKTLCQQVLDDDINITIISWHI